MIHNSSISFKDLPLIFFHAVKPFDAPPLITAAAVLGLQKWTQSVRQ